MTLARICDTCGVTVQGEKRPTGWRVSWDSEADVMRHTCAACMGAPTTSKAKPRRKAAKTKSEATEQGSLL